MAVYLHLRKNIDWATADLTQLNPAVTNPVKLRRGIELWDENLGVRYFDYRSSLKQLASDNWSAHRFSVDPIVGDDDWLVPTDDDDWVSPILDFPRDAEFVHWRSLVVKSISPGGVYVTGEQGKFPESNAYAIKGSLLRRLSEPAKTKIVQEHQKSLKIASEYGAVAYRPEVMSVYNLHPGCAHVLKSIKTKVELHALFMTGTPMVQSPWWVETYVARFAELYKKVTNDRGQFPMDRAKIQ